MKRKFKFRNKLWDILDINIMDNIHWDLLDNLDNTLDDNIQKNLTKNIWSNLYNKLFNPLIYNIRDNL